MDYIFGFRNLSYEDHWCPLTNSECRDYGEPIFDFFDQFEESGIQQFGLGIFGIKNYLCNLLLPSLSYRGAWELDDIVQVLIVMKFHPVEHRVTWRRIKLLLHQPFFILLLYDSKEALSKIRTTFFHTLVEHVHSLYWARTECNLPVVAGMGIPCSFALSVHRGTRCSHRILLLIVLPRNPAHTTVAIRSPHILAIAKGYKPEVLTLCHIYNIPSTLPYV